MTQFMTKVISKIQESIGSVLIGYADDIEKVYLSDDERLTISYSTSISGSRDKVSIDLAINSKMTLIKEKLSFEIDMRQPNLFEEKVCRLKVPQNCKEAVYLYEDRVGQVAGGGLFEN